jgi:deoxyribodipyrimidine photo-lyase
MAREQRVHHNWALLHALAEANTKRVPFFVLFALGPMFNHGSARHNEWMVKSLQDVAKELQRLSIPFFIRTGVWAEVVKNFVQEQEVGQVVLDFNPLEPVRSWRRSLVPLLEDVTIHEVDARNIVPCWLASPKAEFAAYTFRPKVTRQLKEFLLPFPKVTTPKVLYRGDIPPINWGDVTAYRQCDYTAIIPATYIPGTVAGNNMLKEFIAKRLPGYASKRNDPNCDGVSHLSPYLRWGNISAQQVALTVQVAEASQDDKNAFLEELIVRRELSDNYCFYTKQYDQVAGAHAWAQKTIAEHANDKREFLYTRDQFEHAQTHDELWNAAQNQMIQEGKMHGFMRMYWAKKILEWTPDAQTAIDIALYLNDKYELDGRDSNGVVGVMWSICGVHDRAWNERPVFGKIRYMNYAGCKRKFDVKGYEARYGSRSQSALLL